MSARPAPLLLAVLLAGCPLPQPLPDYAAGQPVTPPRVVVDDTVRAVPFPQTIVEVPAGCTTAPSYPLSAFLRDANINEAVVGRWFVNYDLRLTSTVSPEQEDEIPAPPDNAADPTLRNTETFTFLPYDYPSAGPGGAAGGSAGALQVVELVVSNNFDPAFDSNTTARPYRKPRVNFEVQVFRWVFLTVPESAPTPCP